MPRIRGELHGRGEALACEDLRMVEAAGMYMHERPAILRLGYRPLFELKDLGSSCLVDHDGTHRLWNRAFHGVSCLRPWLPLLPVP